MSAPLPWLEPHWTRWWESVTADRLAHALLISGPQGIGKTSISQAFIQALLCEDASSTGEPCHACRGCQLQDAGNHPDLIEIAPEDPGKPIKIDQIRALSGFFTLKSHYARYRIAVLAPANAMNRAAANALLKILEEPPPQTVLMLLSCAPALLPATVTSRCQRLALDHYLRKSAITWLAERCDDTVNPAVLLGQAGGAPLRAAHWLEVNELDFRVTVLTALEAMAAQQRTPLAVAEHWCAAGESRVLAWLLILCEDLIRIRSGGDAYTRSGSDLTERLKLLENRLSLQGLFNFHDNMLECARRLSGQVNVRKQALMEALSLSFADALINTRPGK